MTLRVFDTEHRIVPNTVFTLLPWQLASVRDVGKDFGMTFFRMSQTMFVDTLSGLWRLRPGFFFYMNRHPLSRSTEGHIRRFEHYCDLLAYWNAHSPRSCRRETIMQCLRLYYWTLYTVYMDDPAVEKTPYSHKEESAFKFMCHVVESHSPDRDVAYYASRLGLTPKSLTNLIRSLSGRSARDWIVHYTIYEIKALLRDSTMDIKSIASRTNFPDQASLSRYFRRYTGMTPSQYRESFFF